MSHFISLIPGLWAARVLNQNKTKKVTFYYSFLQLVQHDVLTVCTEKVENIYEILTFDAMITDLIFI